MELLISAASFEASSEVFQGMGKDAGRKRWQEHQKERRQGGAKCLSTSVTTLNINWSTNFISLLQRGDGAKGHHPPTQPCPDPHRHRISQSKSTILLTDGQAGNLFCASWQGEHHNWDHLQRLCRKQGLGLCLPPQVGEEEARHVLWLLLPMAAVVLADPPQCPALVEKVHSDWSQGHEQQAVSDVVLASAQDFGSAASSHGWMQPSECCL